MHQTTLADTAEFSRVNASLKLDPKRRSGLGQYLTPAPIGRFMASLFAGFSDGTRLLDPGAGVGSLSAAVVERTATVGKKPRKVSVTCYEIEPLFIDYLKATLEECKTHCQEWRIKVHTAIHAEDYILSTARQPTLFQDERPKRAGFTHVIMNPPYKKIHSASEHRVALRKAGLETSNLYTGFLFLAAQQLELGGEMVAIVPRSFCNGPYFKPFREKFFALMTLRHLHLFETRNSAFKDDEVLQENIILHAVKGEERTTVRITTSRGSVFEPDRSSSYCVTEDMTQRVVDHRALIRPDDPDQFVHIVTNNLEQSIVDRLGYFTAALSDLGLEVSTGPVVDFRLKENLRQDPAVGAVPLLYTTHFQNGTLQWPKETKKPNAIQVSAQSRKLLWANTGYYVVTRRFTTKEEPRRIVASVYNSSLPGELIGFENHLNVFHAGQRGFSRSLAVGLCVFLNSSLVDRFFRQFNGHTQVNATDLRALRYPDRETLKHIGQQAGDTALSQRQIDDIIEDEVAPVATADNPLTAQRKIDDALAILKALSLPKGQHNERSALTLLALLELKPDGVWQELNKPLMGITPIMDYCREHYGREYAPNTRETFRRQTMHQFVEAGIALYNPDQPNRAVNSPKACYQISEEAYHVILTFGTDRWPETLAAYLAGQETLAAKWAKHRDMQKIPVTPADGKEITLTPGTHSELIKAVLTEFAPRFAPGSEVIYVGDAGEKTGYFERDRLNSLGVSVDKHGKMPDVVLYFQARDWLLLVESVTSHGPVDAKRHSELASLFQAAKPGLVYMTAFPDRGVMGRYLNDISWETEVWCADAPSHLIHFDGERFLGPYEREEKP